VPVEGTTSDGTQYYSSASGPIAYGNGLFVAGGPNRITTSPDGISWTSRLGVPYNQNWGGAGGSCIIYVDGFFVTGDVDLSQDGINWTHVSSPILTGLAHGNGQFVGVGGDPNCTGWPCGSSISTSPDGTNWTRLDGFPFIAGVAYGNGQFVAVTGNPGVPGPAGYILISSDGISWPLPGGIKLDFGTGNTQESVGGITFGDGGFLAWGGANSGQYLFSSADGVTWTRHQWTAGPLPNGITYLNGSFWAYGNSSRILECRTVPLLAGIQPLLSGASQLAVRGVNGRINSVETSTDLTHWAPLGNVTLTNGIGQFMDLSATNSSRRFYRAVAE
jgi:hypothetical protein